MYNLDFSNGQLGTGSYGRDQWLSILCDAIAVQSHCWYNLGESNSQMCESSILSDEEMNQNMGHNDNEKLQVLKYPVCS